MSADRVASVELIEALRREAVLSDAAAARALQLSCASPGPQRWRQFLDWLLLGLGATLMLIGLVLAVAFNWAALPAFAKLGLVAALMSAAVVAAWKLTLATTGGQVALTCASVLIGPLLAIYGQTYQTGADPYQLFFGWAALALVWVVAAKFPPLLLVELALIDTALTLLLNQEFARSWWGIDERVMLAIVGGVQLLAWVAVELAAWRGVEWLHARWFARVLGLASVGLFSFGSFDVLTSSSFDGDWSAWLNVVGFMTVCAGSLVYFQRVRRDLFLVAVALSALMVVGTSTFTEHLLPSRLELGTVFLLGLIVMSEVAGAAWWLRRLHRDWEARQ